MKPVRLPASATHALPRWGLIALCLLYILPGLIRRGPWKTDDAAGFGIMWTMARGGLDDWLLPHIVGLPMPEEGPLAFWIGAAFIKLFGWLLDDALAARLSAIGFLLIGALLVYLGCLGLLLRSHETSAEALQISLIAFTLYATVRLLESQSKRTAAILGVTLGLLVLTRG